MNRGHNKYKDCDITLYPVVDFSLAVNDTLKVGGGMWVTLHKKIFETSLKDSVYIYHRRFGSDKVTTVIVANRDFGIIGKYEIDAHGLISDCIGKIYLNESVSCNSTVPLSKPKIDLQDVKIFHR